MHEKIPSVFHQPAYLLGYAYVATVSVILINDVAGSFGINKLTENLNT
jgi:hypothetical protein